jgi:hypothetical protein
MLRSMIMILFVLKSSQAFPCDMIATNIIFLLIIMVIACNGCNKTFKHSGHGLSRHRTSCLAAKEHTALLAQKRLDLQKVGNGRRNAMGPSKDTLTGDSTQQQEVMEDVSLLRPTG